MDFTKELKEKRPNLSVTSLKTYNSLLKTIYRNSFEDKDGDVSKFDNDEQICKFLSTKPFSARKTYLSALVCICPTNKKYKELMLDDIKTYNHETDKMEMNEKQKLNHVTNEKIREVQLQLKQDADAIFKKQNITINDLQKVQDYIIVCLLGGQMGIVPRRALDYTEFKIRNINQEHDNYLDKNTLYFNKYKTSKFYGQQSLTIPTPLKNILNKWIKIIPANIDYLLFNTSGNKLTAVTLNQRLNKIFNGYISINALRHAYLTDKYADVMKKEQEMAEEMGEMGSSEKQAKVYIKIK